MGKIFSSEFTHKATVSLNDKVILEDSVTGESDVYCTVSEFLAAFGYTPENVANKVSSWSETTNNDHYAGEKLVKDTIDAIVLEAGASFQGIATTSTDPTEVTTMSLWLANGAGTYTNFKDGAEGAGSALVLSADRINFISGSYTLGFSNVYLSVNIDITIENLFAAEYSAIKQINPDYLFQGFIRTGSTVTATDNFIYTAVESCTIESVSLVLGDRLLYDGSAWTKTLSNKLTGDLDLDGNTIVNLKKAVENGEAVEFEQFSNEIINILPGKNLFNTEDPDYLTGGYLAFATGAFVSHASYVVSGFIPVIEGESYCLSTLNSLCYYDTDKEYLSGVNPESNPLVAPAGAAYMKVNINVSQVAAYQIEKATAKTSYESFRFASAKRGTKDIMSSLLYKALVDKDVENSEAVVSKRYALENHAQAFPGKNLFNPNASDITINNYLDTSTGGLVSNSGYKISGYIKVTAETEYTVNVNKRKCFYDINKVFLSGDATSVDTFTTPAGTAYMRFDTTNADFEKAQLELGDTQTIYEEYKFGVGTDQIKDGAVTAPKTSFLTFSTGKNKFNYNDPDFTPGYYVANNGTLAANASYDSTGFIPVTEGKQYSVSYMGRLAWYDSYKKFLQYDNPSVNPLVVPAGAAYLRSTMNHGDTAFQLEEGIKVTNYEVYEEFYTLNGIKVLPQVRVILPRIIHAVVGDTLQLFYRGIIEAVDPYQYDVRITCSKGLTHRRYWEFTPTEAGDTSFIIEVYDERKNLLASNSTTIRAKVAVQQPTANTNILCVGDSLTAQGYWVNEMSRRLKGTAGTPVGNEFSNISYLGSISGIAGEFDESFVGFGGKTWEWYNEKTDASTLDYEVFVVHDKDASDQLSIWQDSNTNQWKLETIQNTNELIFSHYSHTSDMPDGAGTLTHVSGATHTDDIDYTSTSPYRGNPFWDDEEEKISFINFCTERGYSGIDVAYILLGWNGLNYDYPDPADHQDQIDQAKIFLDNLHADYPDAKVKIMGLEIPSTSRPELYFSWVKAVNGLRLAYMELVINPTYSSFVEYIDIAPQFDSEYSFPYVEKDVNTRMDITEMDYTNILHPSEEGYYQIADAVYRNFIANFCQ